MVDVSVKGRRRQLPSYAIGESEIVIRGSVLRIAEIFDEYWLEATRIPDPASVLTMCESLSPKPDLFTFAQRVPEVEPKWAFPSCAESIAGLPLSSYEEWFGNQITAATRRNIRAAEKRGVVVRAADFGDDYIRGIMAIYNESPVRQGRRFWHYGKGFEAVKSENGTYQERSTFLGAYYQEEMIGYLKLVWDEQTAAIMQVLSKLEFLDRRPNNALLAEAVRQCCSRGRHYLLYERFVYGNKSASSLTEFKRSNGFLEFAVPRYYIPLTLKGRWAIAAGLHRGGRDRLPGWVSTGWTRLRSRWYGTKRH
jgi:hypothetical protein